MTENNNQLKPTGIKLWLMAVRAYSFPASVIPILFGSVLAVALNPDLSFNWGLFAITLTGAILVHIGSNVINDIYDYRTGMDKEDKENGVPAGGSMVLSFGWATEKQMKMIAIVSLTIASLIGVFLFTQAGEWILYLSLFGLLSAIFYTATPVSLKYKALGDLQVILSFGVGMTLGAYIVQTGSFSWIPVILSIPFGLLIDAILHANNIRDINFDGKFGVKTLPILIGENASKKIYYLLISGAYLSVIVFVVLSYLPWTSLLVLLTLPIGIKLMKMIRGIPQEPHERFNVGTQTIVMTAQFNMQFGLMVIIGVLIYYFFF
ncbi:1,4-dihydroxy-2-naphthoate octaprenyltransferase [Ignavibacteria bacterium CHB1]|nr:MAG: 1,4-dihydroxy-2-naphthoate octaprenyltransferase [Chlorobiota bacterium]MBV6398071.1 1,4-dihydroxy-2-naphthoate octaprenyltransferase [Ignavibacteria bacterium]MCC6886520.1 1,4-dihydroxy-2-naphthoate octaprenyltransferase [Ignavibacteriales bacterium]MCE7952404.1 1,4-dihydroxy-2-naphthoate octaprenyltransferase [Chlorobi bacterium CHB7]MDL1886521.1 1,4-dihydroxy-2-naphthoate octaprenyltransferase [Ignavibacteria bacterium CHB1]RIK48971.1 MAG: 1,4-dihydroxy-2-naphthoate octaprenyltransf